MIATPRAARRADPMTGLHWRGHAFLFGDRRLQAYEASSGRRLLLIFVVLEGVLGPRLSLLRWLHVAAPPDWVRVPALLILALALIRYAAGVRLSQIGLVPWSTWSAVEKSYFIQVIVIANAVFAAIRHDRIRAMIADFSLAHPIWAVIVPYLLWGFYQELMYRGILQTELTRRWGATRGIVASNLTFTFGPLHFYHFSQSAAPVSTFIAIFITGLFFGILFERSRNLWMVGVFHGVGDAYIDGLSRRG
jgi:membrane protease YdiL (CAAX protease family)